MTSHNITDDSQTSAAQSNGIHHARRALAPPSHTSQRLAQQQGEQKHGGLLEDMKEKQRALCRVLYKAFRLVVALRRRRHAKGRSGHLIARSLKAGFRFVTGGIA
jgi:hypothetical protein